LAATFNSRLAEVFKKPTYSKLTLVFNDPAVERAFWDRRSMRRIYFSRIGFAVMTITLLIFLANSSILSFGSQAGAPIVVQGLTPILIVSLCGFLATYVERFKQQINFAIILVAIVSCLSLLRYDFLASQVNPRFNSIYPALMILSLFTCSVTGITFRAALAVAAFIPTAFAAAYTFKEANLATNLNGTLHIFTAGVLSITSLYYRERYLRDSFAAGNEAEWEHDRTNWVIKNVFPLSIGKRILNGENRISETRTAGVLFMDLVGFTKWASQIDSAAAVEKLNEIFNAIDELSEDIGTEKVKTLGDGYMVVSGLPDAVDNPGERLFRLALGMREIIQRSGFNVRIGISLGPVTGGVVGLKRSIYDIWGHTVNFASRLESSCPQGAIQVSDLVYNSIGDRSLVSAMNKTEGLELKGIGKVTSYVLPSPVAP
jgi:class 3 adenylate cyclase